MIIINGGIGSLDEAESHLAYVDGVMMGRAAYQTPAMLLDVDARLFGEGERELSDAVETYVDYIEARLKDGAPLNAMTKHMLGLFHGRPGARLFRRHLSENATRKGAGIAVLRDALAYIDRDRAEAA
jgi:tRNA-dihydrouridine synthase A